MPKMSWFLLKIPGEGGQPPSIWIMSLNILGFFLDYPLERTFENMFTITKTLVNQEPTELQSDVAHILNPLNNDVRKIALGMIVWLQFTFKVWQFYRSQHVFGCHDKNACISKTVAGQITAEFDSDIWDVAWTKQYETSRFCYLIWLWHFSWVFSYPSERWTNNVKKSQR